MRLESDCAWECKVCAMDPSYVSFPRAYVTHQKYIIQWSDPFQGYAPTKEDFDVLPMQNCSTYNLVCQVVTIHLFSYDVLIKDYVT